MAYNEKSKQNLRPFNSETGRIAGLKGGKKSAEVQRRKKAFKELAQEMLELSLKDGKLDKMKSMDVKGKNLTVKEVMIIAQFKKALKGDENALKLILAMCGENFVDAPEQPVQDKTDNAFINALNFTAEKVWNDEEKN